MALLVQKLWRKKMANSVFGYFKTKKDEKKKNFSFAASLNNVKFIKLNWIKSDFLCSRCCLFRIGRPSAAPSYRTPYKQRMDSRIFLTIQKIRENYFLCVYYQLPGYCFFDIYRWCNLIRDENNLLYQKCEKQIFEFLSKWLEKWISKFKFSDLRARGNNLLLPDLVIVERRSSWVVVRIVTSTAPDNTKII